MHQILTISGLCQPHAFQELVLAMKKRKSTIAQAPAYNNMLERAITANDNHDPNVVDLLRDIRDELRQHNEVLQSLKKKPDTTSNTAEQHA